MRNFLVLMGFFLISSTLVRATHDTDTTAREQCTFDHCKCSKRTVDGKRVCGASSAFASCYDNELKKSIHCGNYCSRFPAEHC